MKATELMIGDWVQVSPSEMPIKVAAVHNKKVAYHACTNKLSWVRESLLTPIPITPEIYEKNGCTYNSDPFALYWEYRGRDFHYHECLRVQYVHEFQQGLRLLGIKKEIVL